MRCEHEHDDGAYVLGALSPSERAAYERHLATCSFCREAVAEIAVLPGLLGRLDPADFAKLLDPTLTQPAPPPRRALNPNLVSAVQKTRRQERKKIRVRILSTALAAAVLALIVGVGAVFMMSDDAPTRPPGPTLAMRPVDQSVPLTAQIGLTSAPGGTRVNLRCFYDNSRPGMKPYTVRLMVYGPDDESDQLGSWTAVPGKEFTMPSAATHLMTGDIARLDLVRLDGKVLLSYDVP